MKQVRDNVEQGVNTEQQIGVRQSAAPNVTAWKIVLEFWPVKQQTGNMIRYFNVTELSAAYYEHIHFQWSIL